MVRIEVKGIVNKYITYRRWKARPFKLFIMPDREPISIKIYIGKSKRKFVAPALSKNNLEQHATQFQTMFTKINDQDNRVTDFFDER
ncbi:hypothetical protein X798_06508 [Onchocerca flexuosa]|uniref:Uncharacterized protein n=1 Tax=Onchocerca flexuosa TaxID=387005 RepID=A0A238BNS0_9BILA|nr:hypothetical protein X798_06508 [Onchocerca flexuosa]